MNKCRTIANLVVDLTIAYRNKLIVGFIEHSHVNASNFYPSITILFFETTPNETRVKLKEFIEQKYEHVRKAQLLSSGALQIEYLVL